MTNIKEVVEKFISTYKLPSELTFIGKHYSDKSNIVEDYINEHLLFDIKDISSETINEIKKNEDYISMIDGNTDIYEEDLIKNIKLFWDYIDTFGNKNDFFDNLMKGQYNAYENALIDIKEKFINFLDEEIKK